MIKDVLKSQILIVQNKYIGCNNIIARSPWCYIKWMSPRLSTQTRRTIMIRITLSNTAWFRTLLSHSHPPPHGPLRFIDMRPHQVCALGGASDSYMYVEILAANDKLERLRCHSVQRHFCACSNYKCIAESCSVCRC